MLYRKLKKYKYQIVENVEYNTGIKWPSIRTEYIRLYTTGHVWIKAGYCWDGPSGPTFDTDSSMLGSLLHDALYQLIRTEQLGIEYKGAADDVLRDVCIENGMAVWRANAWHWAVKTFGSTFLNIGKPQDVIYEV